MHWLWFHAGLSSGNSDWYLFPSGIGSIIERLIELVVIGGILLWRHNCHEPHCPFVGRHILEKDGHHQLYCGRHLNKHKPAPGEPSQ